MYLEQAATATTQPQEDWPAVLDQHGVQFLVLDTHRDRDLLELFRSSPGWKIEYEDRAAVLFAHSHAARG